MSEVAGIWYGDGLVAFAVAAAAVAAAAVAVAGIRCLLLEISSRHICR